MANKLITGIIGELGVGKTATGVYLCHNAFMAGELIFSNYPLYFEHIKLTHPAHLFFIEQILRYHNIAAKVFLDEAWRWISSFLSQAKIQLVLSYVYSRSRKEGWDLVYTTQRFKSTQIRLRAITDALFAPRALPAFSEEIEYFKVSVVDTVGTMKGRPFRVYAEDVFDLFDTNAETYGFQDFYTDALDFLSDVPIKEFHLGKLEQGVEEE